MTARKMSHLHKVSQNVQHKNKRIPKADVLRNVTKFTLSDIFAFN